MLVYIKGGLCSTYARHSGQWAGGATPRPHAGGQGQWPGGATPRPRPGAVAGRTNPTSKELWLPGAQEGLEELSHVEGQEGQR